MSKIDSPCAPLFYPSFVSCKTNHCCLHLMNVYCRPFSSLIQWSVFQARLILFFILWIFPSFLGLQYLILIWSFIHQPFVSHVLPIPPLTLLVHHIPDKVRLQAWWVRLEKVCKQVMSPPLEFRVSIRIWTWVWNLKMSLPVWHR